MSFKNKTSVIMFRRSLVLVSAVAALIVSGSIQTAVGKGTSTTSTGATATGATAAVVVPMIVADMKKKELERDARLASSPMDRCSGCHREILPFSNLPVLPDTTLLGFNSTEPSPEWTEKEVASIQWHTADDRINWAKVKMYSRDKGKVKRIYTYEEPYQPTRFFLPADGGESPHKILED